MLPGRHADLLPLLGKAAAGLLAAAVFLCGRGAAEERDPTAAPPPARRARS